MKSCAVVGGGIVGLATAYRLLQARPDLRVTLLEKESAVGQHQSTRNSGVLHAGLYYAPGSAKARLAVTGRRQMRDFCRAQDVGYEICGKVVVATTEEEVPRLHALEARGRQNGLQGLAWLNPKQLREREPHAVGRAALLVPEEGIVDYAGVCAALQREIVARGGQVKLGWEAVRIESGPKEWRIASRAGEEVAAKSLINCAGLQVDRVATLAGVRPATRIVPFRGEYYRLRPERQHLVQHLIYPLPDSRFPFLGVHLTRLIGGGAEAGPNAVLAWQRESYTGRSWSWRDAGDVLTFPGFWRFAAQHRFPLAQEWSRSLSKTLFCRALQRLVPDLQIDDLIPGPCGVRAQAMNRDGTLLPDFHIAQERGALHLLNAPSPAATASLAIGEELVARLLNGTES